MLLSLPILHHARVNALLLQRNKQALFINLSAYNLAGTVKLFPLNTLTSFLSTLCGFALASHHKLLFPLVIHNKRRAVL